MSRFNIGSSSGVSPANQSRVREWKSRQGLQGIRAFLVKVNLGLTGKTVNKRGFLHDNNSMNKTCVLTLLILLGGIGVAAAETVMIYTADSWISQEERASEDYIVYTMEDGLLETLFDDGHIIYNDYSPPLTRLDYDSLDRVSLKIARSGGADYLVEIEMEYNRQADDKASLPSALHYRFSRVPDSRLLLTGTLTPGEIPSGGADTPRDICRNLGTEIGNRFIEALSRF